MLKNYFILALRNLVGGKIYSLINIVGLAVALTSVILIALFLANEYSYDKHFEHAARLYRIPTKLGSYQTHHSPLPLAGVLQERFADVEAVTRLLWMEPPYPYFSPREEDDFRETQAYYADSSVLDVFGITLIEGSPKEALTHAQTVILSASLAKKYFPDSENVINRTIRYNNSIDLKVTGVFSDFPVNSHIRPALFVSAISNRLMTDQSHANWDWLYPCLTYVRLKEGADLPKNDAVLKDLFFQVTGYTREQYNADYQLKLQAVQDIHLESNYPGENNGNKSVTYTFAIIGIVIILIAAINFMNLATARSLQRAREVGMRKVLGGTRSSLIAQFLTESVSTVMLSGVLAVISAYALLNEFNELIGANFTFSAVATLPNLLILFIFILMLGMLAGLYPAFFLSKHNPALVLKGKFSKQVSSIRLRKALVIVQFAIGFVVLSGTFIVNGQLNFMLTKDLGYTKDNIITIELPADSVGVDRLRDAIALLPNIVEASKMSESFNNVQGWRVPWYEGAPPERDFSVTRFHTDSHFIKLADLQLVAGRFFNEDFQSDSLNYVLNETAIKRLDWKPEEAIGKLFGNQDNPGKVIGIVKDFNFRHLTTPVAPFIFFPPSKRTDVYEKGRIAVRMEKEANLHETIALVEKRWNELVPNWPFQYTFLDEDVAQQYQTEQKLSLLTQVFSVLAMLISALGLFGLASFSIVQRVKEIGIRKVLGAKSSQLVFLTTRDFIALAGVGVMLGIPGAYWLMNQWLDQYAFRIPISITTFIMAVSLSLFIAACTVMLVAWKASISNPVDALKQD